VKAYLEGLYTVAPTIELDNNLCAIYSEVLRFLLGLYEKADNEIDVDLLQILATVLPLNRTDWRIKTLSS